MVQPPASRRGHGSLRAQNASKWLGLSSQGREGQGPRTESSDMFIPEAQCWTAQSSPRGLSLPSSSPCPCPPPQPPLLTLALTSPPFSFNAFSPATEPLPATISARLSHCFFTEIFFFLNLSTCLWLGNCQVGLPEAEPPPLTLSKGSLQGLWDHLPG